MKTLVLAAVVGFTAAQVHAQGTIRFANSKQTGVFISQPDNSRRLATAEDNLLVGVFYGPANSPADSLLPAPGLASIGPEPGVMINAPISFSIPGTEPLVQLVSLQVRAWDAALGPDGWLQARDAYQESPDGWCCEVGGNYYGQTRVTALTVAPPDIGVGAIIWDASPGGDPFRLEPLNIVECPEPSIVALGALGGLGWLIFLRRRRN